MRTQNVGQKLIEELAERLSNHAGPTVVLSRAELTGLLVAATKPTPAPLRIVHAFVVSTTNEDGTDNEIYAVGSDGLLYLQGWRVKDNVQRYWTPEPALDFSREVQPVSDEEAGE
jgi:hypothetical protein